MKRYNQVRDGSYEPRSEMVEETDGDYVLWEDVEELQSKCAELESKCAELLEALKAVVPYVLHLPEHATVRRTVCAAIAKAEGGEG